MAKQYDEFIKYLREHGGINHRGLKRGAPDSYATRMPVLKKLVHELNENDNEVLGDAERFADALPKIMAMPRFKEEQGRNHTLKSMCREYLRYLEFITSDPATIRRIIARTSVGEDDVFDKNIIAQDKLVSAVFRTGQAKYKRALMRIWGNACAVTGISDRCLLRASHMKPFNSCDEQQKYNPYNGLILAAHLDALFDRGLITFEENGTMNVSNRLSDKARSVLGVSSGCRLQHDLNPASIEFLQYHRNNVFKH